MKITPSLISLNLYYFMRFVSGFVNLTSIVIRQPSLRHILRMYLCIIVNRMPVEIFIDDASAWM